MRIGIVGGGAIGLLTASYLSAYHETVLYVRRSEQKSALMSDGITLKNKDETLLRFPKVKLTDEAFSEDLMIFAVKQPVLAENIDAWLSKCSPKQSLLFLQNGASHIPVLLKVPLPNIYLGIIEFGSRKLSDTVIQQNGDAEVHISALKGSLSLLNPVFGFKDFKMVPAQKNWQDQVFDKLIVNAVINPLTSLFQITNGELIQNPSYKKAARMVFEETSDILFGEREERHWEKILEIARNTANNHSSMKQDTSAGRETEIKAITGYIIVRAEETGRDCPLSRFIYLSITGLSRSV